MDRINKIPVRVTVDGKNCEIKTKIFSAKEGKETHRRHRDAIIEVLQRTIDIPTGVVDQIHQVWDHQLEKSSPKSKTLRYAVLLCPTNETKNAHVNPELSVESNHTLPEIIYDTIQFSLDSFSRHRRF